MTSINLKIEDHPKESWNYFHNTVKYFIFRLRYYYLIKNVSIVLLNNYISRLRNNTFINY
jgi:hypothetical protein